jgi:hypothetical protein
MVEKLTLVSKIMLDRQAIKLVKENRELKDQLAWIIHCPDALNKALAENNTTGLNAICTCHMALMFSSLSKDELMDTFSYEDEERKCILKKCLIRRCNRLGLSCEEHDNIRNEDNTPYLEFWTRSSRIPVIVTWCCWIGQAFGRSFTGRRSS